MRIAHLVSQPDLNGVATSVQTLIEQQLMAGHDVLLACRPDSWLARQKFDPAPHMLFSDMRPASLRRLGYAIRDWGEDVVHAHASRANKAAMVFRIAARTPTVMTAHARHFQIPWMFAHAVIAPSQQTASYYLRHRLVRASRMHLVPHMFDAGSVRAVDADSRAAARAALGLRGEALLLGSVGDLCERKNQIDMLRILRELVTSGVDAELLLVGETNRRREMKAWERTVSDPALAGRVHLTGKREDATQLLHSLDIYLCTSLDEQGPIATLEAMASGLPVLTVDTGYSAAIVTNEVNGVVFPLRSVEPVARAAVRLAADPALRAAWGKAAREAVRDRLGPAGILPMIDGVYRAAIAAARRRPAHKGIVPRAD